MELHAERRSPGCMGSLERTELQWHQCPAGLAGVNQTLTGCLLS